MVNTAPLPPIPTFEPAPATVQSQYAASPAIVALVDSFALRILPNEDITLFYTEIFNIYLARGWGLDNWGRILGIGRIIQVDDSKVFGFAGSSLFPFNQGTFASKGVTKAYSLTDEAYRRLLLVKALANISSADAASLNVLLGQLFLGQHVYVLEVGTMAVRFVFEFFLKPYERAIFQVPGLLTRGAGVGAEMLEVPKASTFGFAGSFLQPFNQGTFLRSGPRTI
ncbi:MAG: DUF2612 domain-containing protein [Desulfovibrionaceae bacterium]